MRGHADGLDDRAGVASADCGPTQAKRPTRSGDHMKRYEDIDWENYERKALLTRLAILESMLERNETILQMAADTNRFVLRELRSIHGEVEALESVKRRKGI